MSREDYIWIAIRVFGLYVWVLAFLAFVNGLAAAPVLVWQMMSGDAPIEGLTPISAGAASLTFGCIKAVLLFLVGHYLLKDGKWVFDKVNWWTKDAV